MVWFTPGCGNLKEILTKNGFANEVFCYGLRCTSQLIVTPLRVVETQKSSSTCLTNNHQLLDEVEQNIMICQWLSASADY